MKYYQPSTDENRKKESKNENNKKMEKQATKLN